MAGDILLLVIFERKRYNAMGKKRILVADTCKDFASNVGEALEKEYDVQLCYHASTVRELLEIKEFDALVLDLSLPGSSGWCLLEWIQQLSNRPHVAVLTCFLSNQVETALADLDVEMVAMKPCLLSFLSEQIRELLPAQLPASRVKPRASVSGMLLELGLPPHRWGYTYLEDAIEMYLANPTETLTKFVYPKIAKKYGSTSEAVERAIRKIIRDTYQRQYNRKWEIYFGSGRNEIIPLPTNAQFIAGIAAQNKPPESKPVE